MTAPAIHGNRPAYSASAALHALGKAIGEIKSQDGLTWSDVGAVLGVSEDQAAKYADGTATMNAVTFGRGKREWNGRFTGYFDRLCVDSRPSSDSDRSNANQVLAAALALSTALEDDNKISVAEVQQDRAVLEAAFDALGAELGKLRAVA